MLYERRCNACGATWLLTKDQAHYRPRRVSRVHAPRPDMSGLWDQTAEIIDEVYDGQIDLLDQLRSCPKCQLELFTQRKVTKAHPASRDASSAALP